MSDAILTLEDATKIFGHGAATVHAARGISIALHSRRALALVGESGSGKTTCARMAMLEYLPTSGRVLFKGRPMQAAGRDQVSNYRRSVQMIFQDPFASLNPAQTISYHLRRPLKLHRPEISNEQMGHAIRELLMRVKLDPDLVAPKYPHELSGGQRQRVNIARALAVQPEVIVADEPTSMLDVSVRLGVLNLLNDMKRDMNLAMLYITHDIATARFVAEDIAVMYAGQIVEWGSTSEVIDNPQHPYTQLLLSAVPNPDLRFDDASNQMRTADVVAIRHMSAKMTDHVIKITPCHFTRNVATSRGQ
jgi:peptide/nickel transport system ATP-binding protein